MVDDTIYKFDDTGTPLPYYGNTIVSYLNSTEHPIFEEAEKAWGRLKNTSFSSCLAFLPPDSFHMTVLTLCREIDRGTPYWPPEVSKTACFQEIDAFLKEKMKSVPVPKGIVMEVEECEEIRIILKPHNKAGEEKLRIYRDRVAEATGIRHPWHEDFRYHLSLAYRIKPLSEEQKEVKTAVCQQLTRELKTRVKPFLLPEPEFVIFNDMMSYERDLSKRGRVW